MDQVEAPMRWGLGARLRTSWSSDRQLGVRVAVAAAALAVVAVPFSLMLLFVESRWRPLLELDDGARDQLHRYALTHPAFATAMEALSSSGSALAWQVVSLVLVGFLLWKRRWRLVAFVIVATAGSSLLNGIVKTAVHRSRPVVDHPLLHEPGKSFPSGHAQAAVVGYAVVLLVVLPHLGAAWRRVVTVAAVVMVLAIGFSRVALAAHYVSDVVAAYLLGLAWVATMAAVFHVWRPAPRDGSASRPPEPEQRLTAVDGARGRAPAPRPHEAGR